MLGALAGTKTKDYKHVGRRADTRPGGWDPAARPAHMDQDGIDVAVLYGGALASQNLELHLASFEAYNRWLADFCKAAPDRLLGIAYLPMLDVTATVKQMKEMIKLGLRGVLIPAFPQSTTAGGAAHSGQLLALTGDPMGARRYSDPEFDPFWEAAVELNVPVHMHLGARAS